MCSVVVLSKYRSQYWALITREHINEQVRRSLFCLYDKDHSYEADVGENLPC
jgi:hypothetical protein